MGRTVRKILVIDNEDLVCQTCRSALAGLGYAVFCAGEQEARAAAAKESFALVIVNGILEDMTEIAAFEKMRQANPALAGILVTGHTSAEIVIDAMNKGFSRVCKKPLVARQLIEAVRESLKIIDLREDVTRMKILLPLYTLGQKFIAAKSEQEIYEELADAVTREVNVPVVSVMMFDELVQSLRVVAYRGLRADYVENLQIKPGERIAGKVYQSKLPMVLNKAQQHLSPYRGLLNRKELSAAISLPIISKGRVLGVLNVSETRDGVQFRDADIEMLSIIIDQAMMAVENIRSIREKEESSRIRAQLEQYVSPEVSHMLVEKNHNLTDIGHVRELTVLFADIRNFTLLVQYLEPTLLREFLNSFFDMLASIVYAQQGMLDKFMGDAALAIFGAPVELDNPNVAAVSAAKRIMVAFEKLRMRWEQEEGIFRNVGLGIGLSRGPMFLGNVGSSTRLDYTVIGQDVNIAQRLAAITDSGQILLTDRVNATLDPSCPIQAQKNMLLRGMESEVTVYSLAALLPL